MSVSKLEQAKLMRKNGLTYSEIGGEIKVSRGLVSKWLKGLLLSSGEKELLESHRKEVVARSRNKSKLTREMKKVFGEREALIDAQKSFKKNQGNQRFLIGLSMYLSHGSFKNPYLQFSSGEEDSLRIFIDWLTHFLGIRANQVKCRLYLSSGALEAQNRSFWAKGLAINEKQFLSSVIYKKGRKSKEDGLNKGVLQITVSGIAYIRVLKVWKSLILSYYLSK